MAGRAGCSPATMPGSELTGGILRSGPAREGFTIRDAGADVPVLSFARLRNAPLVRAVLLAAGALAVAASFGLHPEPAGGERVAAHRGLASAHTDEAAHGCTACLSHAPVLTAPAAGGTPTRLAPTALHLSANFEFAGRLAGRDLSGRSPPSRS